MGSMYNRFEEFPRHHVVITPSDANDLTREMLIYAGGAGTITVHDSNGTPATYNLTAGDIVPIVAKRVLSTGTTATPVIGLY